MTLNAAMQVANASRRKKPPPKGTIPPDANRQQPWGHQGRQGTAPPRESRSGRTNHPEVEA